MSRIRSRDTKPEEYIRKELFCRGYRYRKNSPQIQGHPDIWMKKHNTAVFVNGCFWHRHEGCRYTYMPKSREEYWVSKFERNKARDRKIREQLLNEGIKILIVWECSIKKMMKSSEQKEKMMDQIQEFIQEEKSSLYLEI